jgi:signal peptidase II
VNVQRAGWWIAAAAFAADQLSKNLLLYGYDFIHMPPGANVPVLPFFDLVMVWNRGVSYGLFQAKGLAGTLLLTAFSLAAVAGLSWWLLKSDRPLVGIGVGLLIGGALGNVIDRVRFGAVADFFHFYAWGRDWYVFNVADAAITLGVIALLADVFFDSSAHSPGRNAKPAGGDHSGREPVIRD